MTLKELFWWLDTKTDQYETTWPQTLTFTDEEATELFNDIRCRCTDQHGNMTV